MAFRSQEIGKPCKGSSSTETESGVMHRFSSSAAVRRSDRSFIQHRYVCGKRSAKTA